MASPTPASNKDKVILLLTTSSNPSSLISALAQECLLRQPAHLIILSTASKSTFSLLISLSQFRRAHNLPNLNTAPGITVPQVLCRRVDFSETDAIRDTLNEIKDTINKNIDILLLAPEYQSQWKDVSFTDPEGGIANVVTFFPTFMAPKASIVYVSGDPRQKEPPAHGIGDPVAVPV